ncbi:Alpha/Beta hydrolase protein, partial [Penicillium odoratum]|uniref:Alpha/Beta hydrolase protein n=1 Tax=Penicillium odoratum TaxID=1167516 RepID=UPI002547F1F8
MSDIIEEITIIQKEISSLNLEVARYNGLEPGISFLPKGFQKTESCRPLQVDTIWERDITIPLRDGTQLRADIFRPQNAPDKLPILLVWTPYGKTGTGELFLAQQKPCNFGTVSYECPEGMFDLDLVQGRDGIPREMLSGFQCFEGPDPAEWNYHEYAVAQVDARGIFKSQGNHVWHGTAEGRDGYDTIEFLGQLKWSNGRVAMIGNSWLATSQWFIAAERPSHLACILPLEGLSDVYRETLCRGGVPYTPFWTFLRDNGLYDVISMIAKYPLMNEFWEDKRAKAHLIEVPAYVLTSMSTALHTVGSTRCYEDIPHEKKWLRLNPTQEWHDLYQSETITDLRKFLDHYTKGIENGWEQTPRARISILRFNQSPMVNLPFSNWPPPNVNYETYYLTDANGLTPDLAKVASGSISYPSDAPALQMDKDTDEAIFSFTFPQKSTLVGPSKAILFMSCPDNDDLDVFVQLRKLDHDGKILQNINIPLSDLGVTSSDEVDDINTLKYLGPTGVLRASHRTLDKRLSKPHWPMHDHANTRPIVPGEVVRLEIGIWPAAIQFEAGEGIALKVSGHHMTLAEFVPLR